MPTPVVIGVGDFVNRSKKIEDALEPLQLMLNALEAAVEDTGLTEDGVRQLKAAVNSLDIVRTWTWPYPDLPGLMAERMGVKPRRKHYTDHGGNQPAVIFDEAARRIAKGETRVALLTGGEALASLSAFAAKKKLPPPDWTQIEEDVNSVFSPTTRGLKPDLGSKHGIGNPIHIYPLYENAYRAQNTQSIQQNNDESAQMYAEFAQVAEGNEYAWSYGSPPETKESIGTPSKKNRMICFPYPLLMNAFNNINLAGACILTSTDFARELGVPKAKWIYPLGGAGTQDSNDFWHRASYHTSPAILRTLNATLEASNLPSSAIDLFDFYSCFPIVPKLACAALNLPATNSPKPITLLGGLTSFGGAGNNYSMHALTEMVRQLRAGKGKHGLVLANGGVVTYQHAVVLSKEPRKDGSAYPAVSPLPKMVDDMTIPQVVARAAGEAVIETYTVEFGRDGKPTRGHIVGRLRADSTRFLANHADEKTLQALCSTTQEPIGRKGTVRTLDDGRNVFMFDDAARL